MPKWPSKESPRDPATEAALRRIKDAGKSGARKLDLAVLELSTLPEAIGRLTQLRVLSLSDNQLSTLPEAIGRLSQLQELSLGSNQLSKFPEAIGQLSQLQELSLHHNQLSMLPEAIGRLSQPTAHAARGNRSALPAAGACGVYFDLVAHLLTLPPSAPSERGFSASLR
jgi:Leucine-rich repeat (LRR) protein